MIQLLWADDDGDEVLEPLGRRLIRKGDFSLIKVVSYSEAIERLAESRVPHIPALLVDTILPHGLDSGALRMDLGILLADKAAEQGVKSVAFLSVVRLDEVLDKFTDLQDRHPRVKWSYFDKITLFDPGMIDSLVKALLQGS
ncbi:MAG: hypothetical protein WCA49_10930 [Candidatus Sulfotelmatobacter sp.]